MRTILHIIKKEFIQFKRDPKMRLLILIAPIVQLVLLGYAVNLDVEVVHTAILDQDRTGTSRELIDKFNSTGYFSIDYYVEDYDELQEKIENAEVILGLVIPNDFEKEMKRNETARLQAVFDGSDGNTASISAGYVQRIVSSYSKNIISEYRNRNGIKIIPAGSIVPETRVWYNPELKTRVFMVPGIVGLLLMIITIILTSLAVVKEKEIGTLEQLIVTPIKPIQLIIGKLIPFALLGFIAIILVLTAMIIVFGIPIRGSIILLFFSTFIFVFSSLGFGLFVSTISKTQQQAMMLAIFAFMLPMVYLSGFAFPIENMPEIIQYVTYIIPLKYFMIIIRGIILKGIGLADLWQELLILFFMGIGILSVSVLRFQKRLS
ncbi:MAG: ABC transporter permease [Ignavibacteria bacterium]|jgi:ABC-2 type transport system permease protein